MHAIYVLLGIAPPTLLHKLHCRGAPQNLEFLKHRFRCSLNSTFFPEAEFVELHDKKSGVKPKNMERNSHKHPLNINNIGRGFGDKLCLFLDKFVNAPKD